MAMGDVGRQVALCQRWLRVMESHELCYVRDAFEEQNEDIIIFCVPLTWSNPSWILYHSSRHYVRTYTRRDVSNYDVELGDVIYTAEFPFCYDLSYQHLWV